jgi:hypothetical protein
MDARMVSSKVVGMGVSVVLSGRSGFLFGTDEATADGSFSKNSPGKAEDAGTNYFARSAAARLRYFSTICGTSSLVAFAHHCPFG